VTGRAPASLASDPPRDLAIATSTATARRVLSGELSMLASRLGRVPYASLSEPARTAWTTFARALSKIAARDRGAFLATLRGPSVSAPLRVWLASEAERGNEPLALQIATSALAELAMTGVLVERVELPALTKRVALRGRGSIALPDSARTIVFERGSVRIDGRDAIVIDDRASISEHVSLSTFDDNPLAAMEAHPDKSGNAASLGDRSIDAWQSAIEGALAIVAAHLPSTREEMELTLQRIVPVGYDAERHLSASYREAIGTIYVSLHPDPMTMAEALVHEHQHTKLNAALAQDEILLDALEPRFASPVRPDLRPLLGILLAVHAFVPVAELWARMSDAGDAHATSARGRARFESVRRGNREGLDVLLANARHTAVGEALLEELSDHQRRHERRG
jgi:HEXXH motif-containing protein